MSETPGEEPMMKLTVEVNQKGQVFISGPIHLELLCLGVLEKARDAIKGWNQKRARQEAEEAQRSKVEIAGQGWLRDLDSRNGDDKH